MHCSLTPCRLSVVLALCLAAVFAGTSAAALPEGDRTVLLVVQLVLVAVAVVVTARARHTSACTRGE